jgi:hypothetical protein
VRLIQDQSQNSKEYIRLAIRPRDRSSRSLFIEDNDQQLIRDIDDSPRDSKINEDNMKDCKSPKLQVYVLSNNASVNNTHQDSSNLEDLKTIKFLKTIKSQTCKPSAAKKQISSSEILASLCPIQKRTTFRPKDFSFRKQIINS